SLSTATKWTSRISSFSHTRRSVLTYQCQVVPTLGGITYSACRAPILAAPLVCVAFAAPPAGCLVPAYLDSSEGVARAARPLAALGCDLSPALGNFPGPRAGAATLKGRRSAGPVIACIGSKRW